MLTRGSFRRSDLQIGASYRQNDQIAGIARGFDTGLGVFRGAVKVIEMNKINHSLVQPRDASIEKVERPDRERETRLRHARLAKSIPKHT